MIEYRQIYKSEIKEVAKMVAETFGEYPMYTLTFRSKFKNKEEFIKYITKLNEVHIKANSKKHICIVGVENHQIVSIVLLQNPKIKRITILNYIFAGGIKLLFPVGFKRLIVFFKISNIVHEACEQKHKDAWYVELLAVSRNKKGQGLGTKMIFDFIIPYVKSKKGNKIALITNTENNCNFYKKNGFYCFDLKRMVRQNIELNTWSFVKEI